MKHSIVLPLYNHEQFIEVALMSCYEQDHDDVEIIIVDDCSSDGSLEIANEILAKKFFKSRFSKVYLHRNRTNVGSISTIVHGLRFATGDVIHILNTDDSFESSRLSVIESHACGSHVFWGFSGVNPVDVGGNPIHNSNLPNSIVDVFDFYRKNKKKLKAVELAFFERNIAVSSGNIFFSSEYRGIWGYLTRFQYCADWLFCLCASFVSRPLYIEGKLLNYRVHSSNSFSSLKEIGEMECDLISVACEVLFLASQWENSCLRSEISYQKLKDTLQSGYLSVEQRQSWRGSAGVDILANFEYSNYASRLRDYLISNFGGDAS